MDTFPLGGISKSLLALFNELGNKFEIDFLLMKHEGIFIPLIPAGVNLLPEPISEEFRNPHPRNTFKNFRKLSIKDWIKWCSYSFRCSVGKLSGGLHGQVQAMDEWLGKHTNPLKTHYDAAIAYQGGRCIYYLIENIDADVKIGYVHNDYNASEVDYMLYDTDKAYFKRLDYLVTISPECADSLRKRFPDIKNKIKVVENICSPKMINKLALEYVPFDDKYHNVRIATMGRFDINQKGIDLAIEAASILHEQGVDFRWYFIGDGNERTAVEALINKFQIEGKFILLGAKVNPYPFIKRVDIYVQSSRFEGKSVALDEVKALAKPIVVTNFSTVYDQFENGKTALICEMKPEDIASKIKTLINNHDLRAELSSNLQKEKVGNTEQAQVFESLLTK